MNVQKVAFAAVLACILVTTHVSAQDLGLKKLEEQQRSQLEVYFDYADRSPSREEWLRIAQFGVQTVVARWEASAAALVDQGMNLPAERGRLEEEFSALLQERYSQWLIDKAFSAQARSQSAELARAVVQANLSKLYKTDQNGILYDSSGDPLMYQTANLDADTADWEATVSQSLRAELAAWEGHSAALRTDLLTYLPDGTSFNGEFTATEAQYRAAFKRELDIAFQREESRFLNARTRDLLSLRKKSEEGTAASIVSQIIAEANAELAAGLNAVRDSLSTDHSATPASQVAIDPAAWQESFRREFDKGMSRWSKAEQELLIQRAQWEKSVTDQFQTGERQWAEAYKELQAARVRWESQVRTILDTGRAQWETKRSELSAAIDQARSELNRSVEERSVSLDTSIANVTLACNQAANILRTADSSLEYWLAQPHQEDKDIIAEVDFWTSTKATYQVYYTEALTFLAETAARINGGEPGSAAYTDIFGADAADSGYLDDYQVALLGAQATHAYWQKQVDIATAVAAYAHDASSLRPTAAQTELAWQHALSVFKERQSDYQQALDALTAYGADLATRREEVARANSLLQQLDGELKTARQRYQDVIDLYSTPDDTPFRQQLQGYYADLVNKSGLGPAPEEGEKSELQAYADFLAAMNAAGLEQEVNGAAQAVARLVLGDTVSHQCSLEELSDSALQAGSWSFSGDRGTFLDSLSALGIDAVETRTSAVFNQLSVEYDKYSSPDETAESRALARLRIVGFVSQLAAQKSDELQRRLAEIALLTSPDLAGWAGAQGVSVPAGADFAEARRAVMSGASASAAQALLEDARAQKQILDSIAADPGSVNGYQALASLARPTELGGSAARILAEAFKAETGLSAGALSDEAARRSAALQKIIDLMSDIVASVDPELSAHSTEIRALSETDPLARAFLSGSSMFAFEGADYGSMVLGEASRAGARDGYIASLLVKDAHVAPAIWEELAREAISKAQAFLVDRGIATAVSGDTVTFRNAANVFDDVWAAHSSAGSVVVWLQEVQQGIGDITADLPRPVADQLQSFMQSMGELFALRVRRLGGSAGASSGTQNALDELAHRMTLVSQDVMRIQGRAPGAESDPAALLVALRSVLTIGYAGGFDSSVALAVGLAAGDVGARFVSQSAVNVARRMIAQDGGAAAATEAAIGIAVTDYLSSEALSALMADPVIAPLVDGISGSLRAATASVLRRVAALSDPSRADWSALGQELRSEYANAVWNTYSPEWFAGVRQDGGRDILAGAGPMQLSVLHSIHVSLSSRWGANGLSEAAWNDYLLPAYYGGEATSLAFDQGLTLFEAGIDSRAAEGMAYAGIERSFLTPTPTSPALLSRYSHAAGVKAAIDAVLDAQSYDEKRAQDAIDAYLATHADADASQVTSFSAAYFDLFRGSTGTVHVDAQMDSWLPLLRAELGGGTLSALSTTTDFEVVAAVDLLGAVSGALTDAGFAGQDFDLLSDVLVDVKLSGNEQAVLKGAGPADCQLALEDYLGDLAESTSALSGDTADRSFELARLYTQGYLAGAGNAEARRQWRQDFRGSYLSGTLDRLDTALQYGASLRTLGSADRDGWFASQVLSQAGRDRAAAIASTDLAGRSGTNANERSIALGINYDLAQLAIVEDERIDLTGWMLSVSGVQAPSDIDSLIQAADGSIGGTEPSREALLLLLGSPQAALWILKRKILAGRKIDADKDSVAPSVWAQALAFQADYSLMNGYVAAAESGALQYGAQRTGGDSFAAAVNAGALASSRAWQDPVFTAPLTTPMNDILGKTGDIESARTSTALDYITGILGNELGAMARTRQGLFARLSFQKQSEELAEGLARSPLAYRAYLSDSLMKVSGAGAPDIADQHLALNLPDGQVLTQVVDAGGIYSVAPAATASGLPAPGSPGPLYENALLEALNQVRVQAEKLNTVVAQERSLDRSGLGDFTAAFSSVFKDAASGGTTALLSDWTDVDLDSFEPTGAAREAVASSQRVVNELLVSTSSTKQRIALLGSALSEYLLNKQASSAAAAAPLKKELDRLVGEYDELNATYMDATAAFELTSTSYAGLYTAARDASGDLEEARSELQKAEAITAFASTGYLNARTGEVVSNAWAVNLGAQDTVSLAVDPDQRLTAAQAGLLRAQAALDALRGLYGGGDRPTDFAQGSSPEQMAYRQAFELYQRQYAAYLAMERLSALLSSAVATQQKNVADAQSAVDANISELLRGAPTSVDFVDSKGVPTIHAYVQVTRDGSGLPDFSFGTLSTEDTQTTELSNYLTGKGDNSFTSDRETWVKEMSDYIEAHGMSFISNWSLAFQHQMSGLDPLDSTDENFKNLFSRFQASPDIVDASGVPATEGIDFAPALASSASSAYNLVMTDPAQKRLYEFFIAMNLLGLTKSQTNIDTETLKSRYLADAKQYLSDQLEDRERAHLSSWTTLNNVGVGYQIAAMVLLNPFTWPASLMFEGMALLFFGLSANEKRLASDIAVCQAGLETEIATATGPRGTVTSVTDALHNATVGSSGYLTLRTNLDGARDTLDTMLGRSSGSAVTAEGVTNSIVTAADVQHVDLGEILDLANAGITDQAQKLVLNGLIDLYIGAATGAVHPATDAAMAVNDMLYDAQLRRDKASSAFDGAAVTLEEVQSTNERAYQKALNDLAQVPLVDPAHPTEAYLAAVQTLQEAARKAYQNPVYRRPDHLNRLLGVERSLQAKVNPSKNPELDRAQSDLLESQHRDLALLWQDRMKSYMAVQEQRWSLMQEDLSRQESQWQATMGAIMKRAQSQWDSAFRTLDAKHGSWQSAFGGAYEDRAATWDSSYVKLETAKAGWVRESAQKAARVGSEAVLSQLGQSAEGGIKDARSVLVSDLGLATPDARAAVAGVLEGKDFGSLLASGKVLNRGIGSVGSVVFAQLGPDAFESSGVLRRIAQMNGESRGEIEKHVLMITASEARKAVSTAARELNEQVDEANQSVADGLERSLLEAGFVRSGDRFQRETVVDSTFGGPVTELHVVPAYEVYELESQIVSRVDLGDAQLLELSASGIQAQVDLAIKDMRGQLEEHFGKEGAEGSATITKWKSVDHEETTRYNVVVEDEKGNHRTITQVSTRKWKEREAESADVEIGAGKFGQWVGAAPEMAGNDAETTAGVGEYSKYLSSEGSGQLAAVLRPFMWSQMKEGMGWAMVARPTYDQKLWDDRGSWVKAPTIRSVADIGLTVAGTMLGGVPGVLLGLADDALFTTLDVSVGQMSWDEGLVSFGKKAVVGLATSAIGGAFGDIGKTITDTGFGGVIGHTMLTGMQSISTNMVSGAINSITYSNGAGFAFDNEAFGEAVAGQQALAGYLGGMASTATSGLLGQWNLQDGNRFALNGHVFDTKSIQSFNGLMGSAVSAGIQYGMTGDTTLNVLNWSDQTSGRSVGLLEMHLGGEEGFSMNLGTGGVDMSLGTIAASMSGLADTLKITGAKVGAAFGDQRGLSTLNAINMMGYTDIGSNIATARDVWSGKLGVKYEKLLNENGYFESRNASEIVMSDALLGGGAEAAGKLATVMGHEGTHYFGNRYEGAAHEVGLQTYSELTSMFGLKGDQAFTQDMVAGIMIAGSWTANEGSRDDWTLTKGGNLVNDQDGWLRDQNGNYIKDNQGNRIGANGIETGLLNILNGGTNGKAYDAFTDPQVRAAQSLMIGAGFQYAGVEDARARMWNIGNDGKTIGSYALLQAFGDTVVAPVLMNGLDQMSNLAVLGGSGAAALARSGVAAKALGRFDAYVAAKQQFYYGAHQLLSAADPTALKQDGEFGPNAGYPDAGNQHIGIDINGVVAGSAQGKSVYSLFEGKVTGEKFNTTNSGYSAVLEYGFNFENYFYDTGVAAQIMHLAAESPLGVGDYVTGTIFVGNIGATDGGTGIVTGPHLHYQLMGDIGGRGLGPGSPEWDMYEYRRNAFLGFVGSQPTWNYSTFPTSTQNYWASDRRYRNFYYNTNGVLRGMGIDVGQY